MKKITIILCLSTLVSAVQSQSYTIKARTGEDVCKQLTIILEDDIAYVQQSEIPNDQALNPAVFNLTSVPSSDGTLVIPSDGSNYWFVPFDNPESGVPAPPSTVFRVRCDCAGGDDSRRSCKRVTDPNTRKDECSSFNCNSCDLIHSRGIAGGNQEEHSGSFAIVKAKKIVFQ